jgi:molybdenum cofactor cytidylyltransferase
VIAGLVLAAGPGSRFGGGKQLADLGGKPLLEHALSAMASAPVDRVLVVLGAGAEEIIERVDLHGAEPVVCPEWEEGMSASLRAGIEAAEGAEAVVVALGDQPLLSPEAVARVIDARGWAPAVRATYAGVPGHPVVLEHELFEAARRLSGDEGARGLLAHAEVRDVPCDGLGSPVDVDTHEDLDSL